jgi:hypothetical protein
VPTASRLLCGLALGLLLWRPVARADAPLPPGLAHFPVSDASTAQPVPVPPPLLGGASIDVSLSDSTGLNALNYSNSASLILEPSWAVGRLWLRDSPFESLSINGRWVLSRDFAGYDPAAVLPGSDHGPAVPCANLTPNNQGTVIATDQTVPRCSYPNSYRFEPGDLSISVTNPGIYRIPKANISINPSIRVTLPFSYQSQYATIITILQAAIGLNRTFFDGRLSVGYSFSATKFFNRSITPVIQAASGDLTGFVTPQYSAADVASNTAAFYADQGNASPPGGFNSSWSISDVFTIGYHPIRHLRFGLTYIISDAFSYTASCASGSYAGVSTNPCTNSQAVASATGTGQVYSQDIRDSQIFWLSATYDLNEWVSFYLSWVNASPLRMPNNAVYEPFITTDYNAFTNVSLGATFSLGAVDESH